MRADLERFHRALDPEYSVWSTGTRGRSFLVPHNAADEVENMPRDIRDQEGFDRFKFVQIMMSGKSCRQVQDPEVPDEAVNIHQLQRHQFNEYCEIRDSGRDGSDESWNRWKSGEVRDEHRDELNKNLKELEES